MLKVSLSKRPTSVVSFCVPVILTAIIAVAAPSSAKAAGGSWGGSGGFGLGSGLAGGSWGGSGGGLFGGRRPIRNLLGRIASGISNASLGSRGGSFGGSGGGSFGSSFSGSAGGWSGGSRGSVDYFAGGSSGSSYGSWGADSFSSLSTSVGCVSADLAAPVYATPIAAQSYVDNSFVDTSFATSGFAGCPTCGTSAGFPIDQGYSETAFSSDTGFYDGSLPNYDGVPVDGGQVIDDGQIIDDDSLYDPGISAPNDYYNGGSDLLDDGSFPPRPGPAGDDTTRARPRRTPAVKPAVLSLALPSDARVYINGRLTKTEGSVRNYVARKLKSGKEQSYQVKAVINRGGKQLVRSHNIRMKLGVTRTVEFDFDKPVTTALALKVPADAKVRLCGAETSATGERRFFETSKLNDGDSWENYEIEVAVNRDGKEVVARKSLKLHAGDSQSIVFDFHDETGELVAVK